MTPDQARAILEAAFIASFPAAHPEADWFLDGQPQQPDLMNQVKPFAFFELPNPRMVQSGLNGDTPPKRYHGTIEVGLFVREGSGTRPFFLMAATLENNLTLRTISGITLREMTVMSRTPAIGWQGRLVVIPYHFDYLP